MKVLSTLAILSYFVLCEAENSTTVNEYCEEQCKDICVPCQEPIKCTEDQKDCGLGAPDPAFGGVCPPHSICVAKEFNCPCYNENGEPYPSTTIVNCEEDELLCTGVSPGNGCPGQDVCVPRGVDNNGNLCDGFCPVECEENQLHCSTNSETGCAQPPECVTKSFDENGNLCPNQQCPVVCVETEFFCPGGIIELGCKEPDTCAPRDTSNSGELCPGTCSVKCDPTAQIKCDGQIEITTGCTGTDACHAKAKNVNGEFCSDNSASHGCSITCPEDEILCPAKMDILGCKEQATCLPKEKDNTGNDCPETSVCPTVCQPSEVPCAGGIDENGCKKPDVCIPQERDYNGNLCPIHCPVICGENEILCEGPREALGCKMADSCSPRGTKTKGNDVGGLCPGHCPASCKHDEILCSTQHDCDGCSTEEICRTKVKDKNGLFCEDDSASHGCPVECDETIGQVLCPTYETSLGCKPKAMCIALPKDSKGENCPSHSACAEECESGEMLCSDGVDSRGCKKADLCLARGDDNDGNLCPAICPPTCTNTEFFCAGSIQNNGCRGEAHCVDKKTDANGIECPEVCPVFCTGNERINHGGTDARGCPLPDTCVVPCTGGDSCCNSLNNKCDVGEGDCDSDADCLDGLKCGTDNCPTTRSSDWDSGDDCCYKEVGECPATHPFAYLGGKYCCEYGTEKVFEAEGEDCDGGPISITSSCCKDDAHLKCPSGYCKNSEASPFSVSGITTESATASIGSTIWTDRPSYLIAKMPNELTGSTVFQPVHYVDIATITVSSTIDAYIRVATRDDRDGGLMDILPADGWTLEDGWFVEWTGVQNNEMLNKIWSKQISAGESVAFTTTKDAMTFAIFASEVTEPEPTTAPDEVTTAM